MLDERTSYRGSFQQLADARRALKVATSLDKHPALKVRERLELRRVKGLAIRCIAAAVEELIDTLDVIGGDPDVEPNGDELDGSNAEDEIGNHHCNNADVGAGCPISDPDSAVDDRPCDDINMDLEPDHDREIETWSHWLDHPPELHIGLRPGWNDGPEAA
jgi:hypothetical protein